MSGRFISRCAELAPAGERRRSAQMCALTANCLNDGQVKPSEAKARERGHDFGEPPGERSWGAS